MNKTIRLLIGVLTASFLGGCASVISGSHLMQAGKPMQKIDPNQLASSYVEYKLSPRDNVLIQIQPFEAVGQQYKLEKANQIRISFTQADSVKNSYKLEPGDGLSLDFSDELEASYELTVSPDGNVTLPRVGKNVHVAGKTLSQLNKISVKEYQKLFIAPKLSWAINRGFTEQVLRLNGEYSVGADGDIVVSDLGRVSVLGKTAKEVESMLTELAAKRFNNEVVANVSIAKVNAREQVDNRLTPSGLQMYLNPNNLPTRINEDGTIFVPDLGDILAQGKTVLELKQEIKSKIQPNYQNPVTVNVYVQDYADYNVFIGGEVRQPGRYPHAQKLSLLKLISQAGWVNENADLGNVLLLRPGKESEYVIYRTNLDEVMEAKGPSAQDFKVSPQDLIIVPPTGIAKANRFVTQYIKGILPFGTSVSYNYNQQGRLGNQGN